jgi:hypothetical protein
MITRRQFVKKSGALAGGVVAASLAGISVLSAASRKKSDIRVDHISFGYDEYIFRAPVGFAGAVADRATMVTVRCSVRTAGGKVASGFGSIPFNYIFSFPSKKMTNETRNDAMKALAAELSTVTGSHHEFAHPLDINWDLAPLYVKAAAEVSGRLHLADPIPKLCPLVTAAAFDAAIDHANTDQFGFAWNEKGVPLTDFEGAMYQPYAGSAISHSLRQLHYPRAAELLTAWVYPPNSR